MMNYQGKYKAFNPDLIKTYPVETRTNKVGIENLLKLSAIDNWTCECSVQTTEQIETVADAVLAAKSHHKPVILFSGAHAIKNGLSLLYIDLIKKGIITLFAGTGATAIHDFELALIGATSEYVPQALETGQFGMAYEFCYQNLALSLGDQYELGYGESLGRMICDQTFRQEVLKNASPNNAPLEFAHPELSVQAACYQKNIPCTIHVGIGTDVIDQHPSFDGRAKGGCSARDFLIYTQHISNLTDGGVLLNIGSAVTGPEVFLKAASMAANVGKAPHRIVTADFDIRPHECGNMTDESTPGYYFRDQKSIVNRVPQAFGGKGYYIQGNQKNTFPTLYKRIIERL